jgi:hypothetical protein
MATHTVLVGIEHLMTGVVIKPADGEVLSFERESPSIMRVTSEGPIEVYWPVTQSWITSTEIPDTAVPVPPSKYSTGQAEWYAQVMGSAMVTADRNARSFTQRDTPDRILERPVFDALLRRFGAQAAEYSRQLRWDGVNRCYMLQWAGMWLGIELDGYMHS